MRFILVAILYLFTMPALAQTDEFRIVAVVEGQAITNYDLLERMEFLSKSAGMPLEDPNTFSEIKEKSLDMLINEKILDRLAKINKVSVNDNDLAKAVSLIEQKNGMPSGSFAQIAAEQGVSSEAVKEQLRQQIIQQKLMGGLISPSAMEISPSELEQAYQAKSGRTRTVSEVVNDVAEVSIPQISLSEITLPTNEEYDNVALDFSRKLIAHIRDGKISFEEAAKKYSKSSTAAKGGKIGWIPVEALKEGSLPDIIKKSKKGKILAPVRTHGAYRIVRINDRRNHVQTISKPRQVSREIVIPVNKAAVKAKLQSERYALESEKIFQKLRSKTYIERRIQ